MKLAGSDEGQVRLPTWSREPVPNDPEQGLETTGPGGLPGTQDDLGRSPIDDVYGILALHDGTDQLLAELRGTADPSD